MVQGLTANLINKRKNIRSVKNKGRTHKRNRAVSLWLGINGTQRYKGTWSLVQFWLKASVRWDGHGLDSSLTKLIHLNQIKSNQINNSYSFFLWSARVFTSVIIKSTSLDKTSLPFHPCRSAFHRVIIYSRKFSHVKEKQSSIVCKFKFQIFFFL